jgi:hypothetical protein
MNSDNLPTQHQIICRPGKENSLCQNTTRFFTTISIWSHGIHVWGCARFSNLQSIHQFQCNKLTANSSPRYVNNQKIPHWPRYNIYLKWSQKTCHIISQASPQTQQRLYRLVHEWKHYPQKTQATLDKSPSHTYSRKIRTANKVIGSEFAGWLFPPF